MLVSTTSPVCVTFLGYNVSEKKLKKLGINNFEILIKYNWRQRLLTPKFRRHGYMSDQVTISFAQRTLLYVINKYPFICQLTYRLIEGLTADKEEQ